MKMDLSTTAPVAMKQAHSMTIHQHTRQDDYFWLRDDERKNKQVLNYLEQENDYTKAVLSPLASLQTELYDEMVARVKQEDASVPYLKKGYWYQTRFSEGKEYPVYSWRKDNTDAEWLVLLDANERAKGHQYYQLGELAISPNHQVLAFSEDTVSRRQYRLRFLNLDTGEAYPEEIEDTESVVWANDSKTLFYVKKHPTTLLPYQVYRHQLGTDISADVLVYEESDDTFYTDIYKSTSDDYIMLSLSSTMTTEVHVLPADKPTEVFTLLRARERGHEYCVDHYRQQFYIRSNKTGKNFGLMSATLTTIADTQQWQTIIPARDDVLLESYELFRDWLVVEEREQGLTFLRQINWQTNADIIIKFDDPTYTAWLGTNPDPDTDKLRYGYSSLTTPTSTYQLNLDSGEREILKQQTVVGDFCAQDYQSERVWIVAEDGVKIPVSLVYKTALFSKSNVNPILQYAYGSYGSSIDPYFSASLLTLLDRGFVYAIAHIRGGEELGRHWYEDGKLLNKMNTFTDFTAVTRGLVEQGYADPKRIYAMGGSAGGLLMGTVINIAPELYHGVVAAVPFVDVVSTMLDESIPLTTGEYDEWGNPNDAEFYHYMLSYSPYDQVTAQAYPNLLVTTGLHDSQVQYWEPAKWVAKLRELKTDANVLLLHTDMETGHGGKSGRFQHYHDTAKEYAFMLDLAKSTEL
ncbi:Protease II [Moritella viscosa]|nr:Protease II [Moritella viscosa]